MSPLISVVIPVYNGEKFVARAVRSALEQEYPPHEVIVVDDGSTDGTPDMLKKFGDKIKTRRIPNSGGASRPRNVGIEMATGDYIAFLDADDFWFKHKLKVIAKFAEKYPNVGFMSSDFFERSDATSNRLGLHSNLIQDIDGVMFDEPMKTDPLKVLLRENFIGTPSGVVVKKSAFNSTGLFNDVYRMAEDLEYYMRAALFEEFLVIGEVLFFKHDHPENMSTQKIKLYNGHRDVLVYFIDGYHVALKQRGYLPDCARALANLDFILGNVNFEAGHRARAFSFYAQALMDSPTPSNLAKFFKAVFKKSVRIVTFDKVNRKTLGY